jgi:hypothetical protein
MCTTAMNQVEVAKKVPAGQHSTPAGQAYLHAVPPTRSPGHVKPDVLMVSNVCECVSVFVHMKSSLHPSKHLWSGNTSHSAEPCQFLRATVCT